jgi:hypothetical protein
MHLRHLRHLRMPFDQPPQTSLIATTRSQLGVPLYRFAVGSRFR